MRRSMGLAAVLVALSLVFPIGASAGPVWGRIPPGTIIIAADPGVLCTDAVGVVTWTYLDGSQSVVAKPDGRLMAAMGNASYEVSGSLSGKAVILKTDGVVSYSADGTVVDVAGKSFWGFGAGDNGPGDKSTGRIYYFVGTQTANMVPDGAFTWSGRILMDVCAAIS